MRKALIVIAMLFASIPAPAASSASTTSRWPLPAGKIKAVARLGPFALTSAPPASKTRTISMSPLSAASCNPVWPSRALAFTAAPAEISFLSTS